MSNCSMKEKERDMCLFHFNFNFNFNVGHFSNAQMRDVYYNLYFRRLSFFSVVGNGPTLVWLLELVVVVVVEVVVVLLLLLLLLLLLAAKPLLLNCPPSRLRKRCNTLAMLRGGCHRLNFPLTDKDCSSPTIAGITWSSIQQYEPRFPLLSNAQGESCTSL